MRKLVLVSLVCLALLVACPGCGKETTTSSSAVFTVNGETGLAAAVALTDNHIQSLVNTMQVLAMTEEVKAGSWEGMQSLLSRFSQDQSPAAVWFALPDGSYYTVELGKASGNLSDRSYFPRVMSGATAIGDLVVSKSTGKMSVITTVPVKNGGQVGHWCPGRCKRRLAVKVLGELVRFATSWLVGGFPPALPSLPPAHSRQWFWPLSGGSSQ